MKIISNFHKTFQITSLWWMRHEGYSCCWRGFWKIWGWSSTLASMHFPEWYSKGFGLENQQMLTSWAIMAIMPIMAEHLIPSPQKLEDKRCQCKPDRCHWHSVAHCTIAKVVIAITILHVVCDSVGGYFGRFALCLFSRHTSCKRRRCFFIHQSRRAQAEFLVSWALELLAFGGIYCLCV